MGDQDAINEHDEVVSYSDAPLLPNRSWYRTRADSVVGSVTRPTPVGSFELGEVRKARNGPAEEDRKI
jgi:hypothetical protein